MNRTGPKWTDPNSRMCYEHEMKGPVGEEESPPPSSPKISTRSRVSLDLEGGNLGLPSAAPSSIKITDPHPCVATTERKREERRGKAEGLLESSSATDYRATPEVSLPFSRYHQKGGRKTGEHQK